MFHVFVSGLTRFVELAFRLWWIFDNTSIFGSVDIWFKFRECTFELFIYSFLPSIVCLLIATYDKQYQNISKNLELTYSEASVFPPRIQNRPRQFCSHLCLHSNDHFGIDIGPYFIIPTIEFSDSRSLTPLSKTFVVSRTGA